MFGKTKSILTIMKDYLVTASSDSVCLWNRKKDYELAGRYLTSKDLIITHILREANLVGSGKKIEAALDGVVGN